MRDTVEHLLEVHKAHTEWLLMLACLVRRHSKIRDMVSSPPYLVGIPRVRLQFLIRSSLGSFPV